MRRQSGDQPTVAKGRTPDCRRTRRAGIGGAGAEKSPWVATAAAYFPWVRRGDLGGFGGQSADSARFSTRRDAPLRVWARCRWCTRGARSRSTPSPARGLWGISDRDSFTDENGDKRPAVQWLLDFIADPQAADKHKVFYIFNPSCSIRWVWCGRRAISIRSPNSMSKPSSGESPRRIGRPRKIAADASEAFYKSLLPQLQKADAVDSQSASLSGKAA